MLTPAVAALTGAGDGWLLRMCPSYWARCGVSCGVAATRASVSAASCACSAALATAEAASALQVLQQGRGFSNQVIQLLVTAVKRHVEWMSNSEWAGGSAVRPCELLTGSAAHLLRPHGSQLHLTQK